MKKSFPMHAALTIWTGRVCGDFGEAHNLMDHFFPGIMTIGMAAMSERGKAEVESQFPRIAEAAFLRDDWSQQGVINAVQQLGSEIELEGPIDVPKAEAEAAFDRFFAGMKK